MNGEEYSPSVQLLLTLGDRGPALLGVEQHAQEPDVSCGVERLSGQDDARMDDMTCRFRSSDWLSSTCAARSE